MEHVTIVIKKSPSELISLSVKKCYLDRLITNIELYNKNNNFIDEYIANYNEIIHNDFLPSQEGIIFIDMVNDVILDSQGITGVNKITPTEIKRSKNGKISDETSENSVYHRFLKLFDAGYLKGFDEWRDNGLHLNTTVLNLGYNDLIDLIMQNGYSFGQFVFSTKPYRVESFNEKDLLEQKQLFEIAKELELIPKDHYKDWEEYLKGLKK